MDEHDIEWRCECGFTMPDYKAHCGGCGKYRYYGEKADVILSFREQMTWQLRMNTILCASTRRYGHDGSGRKGVLSEEEMTEMIEAQKSGQSPEGFAAMIEARDVSSAEAASDPYPGRLWPEVEMN